MTSAAAWELFERRMREVEDLNASLGLLAWDEQTFCSPRGREARSQHTATLSSLVHERVTDEPFGDAVETLAADGAGLTDAQRAMVRVVKHDRDRSVLLDGALVRALAEQASRANRAWEAARAARDYRVFEPEFARLLALKVQQADCLAQGGDRYDALLDGYEPGMTVAKLGPILAGLRGELVPFVGELLDQPEPDRSFLDGPYDQARQRELVVRILTDVGFDFTAGRLDVSTHPFCGGPGPSDVRLTTRYYRSLDPGALLSSLHECGHGLYEQGMPAQYARTAIAHTPSLGLHESQSRFWENVVGRSAAFWARYLPVAQALFPDQLAAVTVDRMVRALNRVRRTPVRVDADEVTYNLHILVRYELERALLDGSVSTRDLADAWNQRYRAYLGYTPVDDLEGVLQDIHWSWGELGYFPTYTIGNLYAAAIDEAIRRDLDLDAAIRDGAYSVVLEWLRSRVHQHGRIVESATLIQSVTGQTVSHEPFMRYLHTKYRALYCL
jgi:carboxypeptidase Taq